MKKTNINNSLESKLCLEGIFFTKERYKKPCFIGGVL